MNSSGELLRYALRDPAIRSNPYPVFARLRLEDPVHWSPALSGWLLTRYDDVRRAHVAPELGSDRITPFYDKLPATQQAVLADVVRYLNLWLVFRSPPEHSRLRKLLGAGFAMPVIQGLEPRIRQIVDALADQLDDELASNGQADVIASFAMMVPAMVILDMIGAPQAMLPSLKAWSDDMLLFIGSAQGVADKYERARSGAQNMSAYFRELIAQRRVQPCDDMISRLIAARDEDDALSEDELVASCMLMLFGGHETTTNLIGNAVHALIRHPEQRAKLIARPELIGSAIEEVLRFESPTPAIAVRSCASSDLATVQPLSCSPIRLATGTRTLSKNTSFKLCSPSMEMIGATRMPGVFMSMSKKLMPSCRRAEASVRTRQNIQSACWA